MHEKLRRGLGTNIQPIPVDTSELASWDEAYQIGLSSSIRLLIPTIIDRPRALHLDSDILALSDLQDLFHRELNGAWIAGVQDSAAGRQSLVPRAIDDPYINAGVLLLDLEALRREGFCQSCARVREMYRDKLTWPDQCLINKLAEGHKSIIRDGHNRLLFIDLIDLHTLETVTSNPETRIIHFVGPTKPRSAAYPEPIRRIWQHTQEKLEAVERALELVPELPSAQANEAR